MEEANLMFEKQAEFIPQYCLVLAWGLIQIPSGVFTKFPWGSLFFELLMKQFRLYPLELLMGLSFLEMLMHLQPDALNLLCLIKLLANHYLAER